MFSATVEVILLVVEGRTAEVSDVGGLHEDPPVAGFLKTAIPALPQPLGNHVHRLFQVDLFPRFPVGTAVFNFCQALGMSVQFESVGAFRTETAPRNGRARVALDRNPLSILVINKLPTAHSAGGAD